MEDLIALIVQYFSHISLQDIYEFASNYLSQMLIFYSFHCFYFIIGIWSVIYGNILIVQSSSFSSSGRLTPKGSSSDNPRFSFVGTKSQAKRQLGKLSLFQKLSFQWVDELIQRDNRIPLQLVDLWSIDDSVTDKSCRLFQKYFDSENSVAIDNTYSHNSNVHPTSSSSRRKQKSYSFLSNIPKGSTLTELWSSPVTRALAKMYQKELIYSGLLKLIKAGLNLLPSLLVSAILSAVESTVTHDKSFSQIILEEDTSINSIFHKLIKLFGSICIQRFDAIGYTFLLLFVLCTKTLVDSQYFDRAVNLGASVRSTLAAVVYRKSAQLTPASRQNNTVGKMMNYLQIDTGRVKEVASHLHNFWEGMMMMTGYTLLLMYFLGPSVLLGLAVIVAVVPINAYYLRQLSGHKEQLLRIKDKRIKLVNEVLQGIRAIKSYNWEKPFAAMLASVRDEELSALRKSAYARAILTALTTAAPSFVAVATLSVYALLGNKLTAAKVFTTLSLFNQLRFPLQQFPSLMNMLAEGNISIKRITYFLSTPEIQHYVERSDDEVYVNSSVVISNATFDWKLSRYTNLSLTPSSSADDTHGVNTSQQLRGSLGNVNIDIKKGELIAVVGPVGSGKSSLLSAILGDMHKDVDCGRVIVNGEIAYVPQTSWIPNDTFRNVVLFGRAWNETKYRDTVRVCNLEKDLTMLDSGDQTEIGEKGVNLSGGQKQRLSIARAVYEDADIYLFDDPLSALDAEVGHKLFNDCIKSALHDKTRILVTHQLSVLTQVDRVILMEQKAGGECVIADQGKLQDLLQRGHDLSKLVSLDITNSDTTIDTSSQFASNVRSILEYWTGARLRSNSYTSSPTKSKSSSPISASYSSANSLTSLLEATESPNHELTRISGSLLTLVSDTHVPLSPDDQVKSKQLVVPEKRATGPVELRIYQSYLNAAKSPILLLFIVSSFLLSNVAQVLQQWIVKVWTTDINYTHHTLHMYLIGIATAAGAVAFFSWLRTYLACVFGTRSSRVLHNNMALSMLSAPLSFFETTPIGRLIQRFSKDMDQMDQQLPGSFSQLVASALSITGCIFTISTEAPLFAVFMVPIMSLYFSITSLYRKASRELKRLESVTQSPIYQQFGETLSGLQVIRSFKRQSMFQQKFQVKVDDNYSAYFAMKAADRWLSIRTELVGDIIVFFSALLIVMSPSSISGAAGLAISNALSITNVLNRLVRCISETESHMNSVERILHMTETTPAERLEFNNTYYSSLHPSINQDSISIKNSQNDTSELPSSELVMSDAELIESGWPWHGKIVFKDVYLRYREGFDTVLNGVSLEVCPGESLGIVGRTGSGKSSLFRILLRLTEFEKGQILIDGVDISKIGLDTLRSCISIIPQDAVLFSGSVRMNLDPFGQHKDKELWSALRKSHAASMIQILPGGLDYSVSEGGENFSAGQRQLLCLARALVRKSKILILDEATSSIDHDTDKLIQATIREEFGHGKCTVLTIAHRLDSIIDSDRILVMSGGRVGEIGTPQALLRSKSSLFSQLVAADRTS